MRFYANDVIFNQNYKERTKLIFQNSYTCPAEVEMIVDKPLEILDNAKRADGKHFYVVNPLSSLEVTNIHFKQRNVNAIKIIWSY